ncbi:MAG: PRC-barrel domain-containing protein [Ignavibacteriaceae bacterium]
MEDSNIEKEELHKLDDIKDLKTSGQYSYIKGWKVFSSNSHNIGIVTDIMVNSAINRAVYFDISLNEDIEIKSGSRHLTIPLTSVSIDVKNESLFLTDIKAITILRKTIRKNNNGVKNNLKRNLKEQETLKERKLSRLKNQESSVPSNSPDIRNWSVLTSDGIAVGKVGDLFIDTEPGSVQYFTVKIDEGPIFDKERSILVPVGLAVLDMEDDKKIRIKIDINEFVNYPPYKGEPVNQYRSTLLNYFKNKNDSSGW